MKELPPNNFKSPVYRVFAHLTDEERIDLACELLAKGVLRLAERRGLLKSQGSDSQTLSDEERKAA